MHTEIEPTGISVRRGAVQIRIDLFNDDSVCFHSHFLQVSPDITDDKLKDIIQKVLEGERIQSNYKPFNVTSPIEELVFNALREGKTPALVGETMVNHLVRSAVKGWDIAVRKDNFKVVK